MVIKALDWQEVHSAIGPFRYQMSEGDCVPTTISNAIMLITRKTLPTKLMSLLWSVSMDTNGTGAVCCQLLSDTINSWQRWARDDDYDPVNVHSEIISGDEVHLGPNNGMARCLNAGGAICLTVDDGGHYLLIIGREKDCYIGFDPTWRKSRRGRIKLKDIEKYRGLVNFRWSTDEFQNNIKKKSNKWCHLLTPQAL